MKKIVLQYRFWIVTGSLAVLFLVTAFVTIYAAQDIRNASTVFARIGSDETVHYIDAFQDPKRLTPKYMGYTAATYTGNLSGIAGANAKCDAEYEGSHMCTQSEALRSGATGFGSTGWIACDVVHHDSVLGNSWCDTLTTSVALFGGYAFGDSSCGHWLSSGSSQKGPYMNSVGSVNHLSCSNTQSIHCCR